MLFIMFLHSVFWYSCFVISLICQIPKLFWAKKKAHNLSPSEFDRYVHGVASRWALANVKRSGARFHVEGIENIPTDKAVVFISNHQGDFDIAAFLAYIPVPHGYVAKIEMMKVPVLRDWMKNMRCVFIDRGSIRQTAGALLKGVETLKNGHSLVLFPEGTRSKSEVMGEFKAASFKLATKAKVPIVPVSINGTFRIMEDNNRLIKPADVYVKIHPAIPTDNLEDGSKLPGRVRNIIQNGLGHAVVD